MKVNPITSPPVFQAKLPVSKIESAITTASPVGKITKIDKDAFKLYVSNFDIRSRITPQEIQQIFSLDGMDFLRATYDFIMKKTKIPAALYPIVNVENLITKNADAQLDYSSMIITIAPDIFEKRTKPQIFGILRHEVQHFMQNLEIFRHETIGSEAVDFYFQKYLDRVESYLKNTSFEELKSSPDKKSYELFVNLKTLLETNKPEFDRQVAEVMAEAKDSLKSYRDIVIREMGMIKPGTKEAKNAELYFEGVKFNYYTEDNNIDVNKYVQVFNENEALTVEGIWTAEAEGKCLLKNFKVLAEAINKLKESDPEFIEKCKRGDFKRDS